MKHLIITCKTIINNICFILISYYAIINNLDNYSLFCILTNFILCLPLLFTKLAVFSTTIVHFCNFISIFYFTLSCLP